MDKMKTSLIDAYVRLGCAQADVVLEKQKATSTQEEDGENNTAMSSTAHVTPKDVDDTLQQLQQWADVIDSKVQYLM